MMTMRTTTTTTTETNDEDDKEDEDNERHTQNDWWISKLKYTQNIIIFPRSALGKTVYDERVLFSYLRKAINHTYISCISEWIFG